MERISSEIIGVERIGWKWITMYWMGLQSMRSGKIEMKQIRLKRFERIGL